MAPHAHEQKGPVRVAVLTVSDTRTRDDDESGALAETLLRDAGHEVVERVIVRDDVAAIRAEVRRLLGAARIVVTTGGTGITPRDSTYEAVSALIEKRLDGFGELFRALSFAEIGPAAMMSRAVAGTAVGGGVLVALPGSTKAVKLALERVLIPELRHLAKLAPVAAASGDATASATPTHVDEKGAARMVDVGSKAPSDREAVAQALVTMSAAALGHVRDGSAAKGDVLAVARVAGIQASKRTSELIPLCHPLSLSSVAIDFALEDGGVRVTSTVRTHDRTGVEMEALVAASVAALTIYDMLKSVDRAMTIGETCLLRKTGGRHGVYERA